ncbi:MAG: S8 family serine peptidase [Bacillota bacterium]|nr:S8 family serine peptidase [Bacillota bacterium]
MLKKRIAAMLCVMMMLTTPVFAEGEHAEITPDVTVTAELEKVALSVDEPGSGPFAYKRIIVFSSDEAAGETLAGNGFGAEQITYYEPAEEYILDFPSEDDAAKAYVRLSDAFGRENVMPDLPVKAEAEPFTETDALSNSWGVDLMGLDEVRDKTNEASAELAPVTVAVLDSGINNSHELFTGRLDEDAASFVEGEAFSSDKGGHGTHVVGIIADGTSDHVNILPVKVLNDEGRGGFAEVINGIYYAVEHGANVINMSLAINLNDYGNYWSDTAVLQEERALEAAENGGIICIAAAGNDSMNLDELKVYPAVSQHTITISSITQTKQRASSSNYGESVDFTAPGDQIISAGTRGRVDYCVKSGTSMAAPHMSAACAMLKLYNREASASQVRQKLQEMATDIGTEGKDKKFGHGYVTFSGGAVPEITGKPQSEPEPQIVIPGTKISKVSRYKKALKIKWKKQSARTDGMRVTGYQIQIGTDPEFATDAKAVTVKGWNQASKKIKKLKRRTGYYVRIRTYMKLEDSMVYSEWSTMKLAKTK